MWVPLGGKDNPRLDSNQRPRLQPEARSNPLSYGGIKTKTMPPFYRESPSTQVFAIAYLSRQYHFAIPVLGLSKAQFRIICKREGIDAGTGKSIPKREHRPIYRLE
jgi:hypothetical protein